MHLCHPAMQTYLADLEARYGLPIRYQRWSSRYGSAAPFRHEVQITGPMSGQPGVLRLPYKNDVREVVVAHGLVVPDSAERIDFTVGDSTCTLAAVEGRKITLTFDLESLFESPVGDLQPGLVLEAILGLALPKAIQNVKDYRWEDEAARFIQWNVQGVDEQIATWQHNIRANEQELDRLQSLATSVARKNSELREQCMACALSTKIDREARAKSEFAALVKMLPSPVRTLELDYGKLSVVLCPITLEYDGMDYEMGSFTLQITTESVRIWSDSGNNYPHPHVSSDGVPCWGNLGPSIARLLGEREYVGLVATVIEFLHSYNEHDAYRRIENWDPDWSADDDES